jgi:glycosyltransferase involved in cell wall biosynthesis
MNAPSATTRLLTPIPRVSRRALRVAVLAPPWIAVPPPAYGGIEAVIALLCDELVARGHDVTLFAAPGSSSCARVRYPLESAHPHTIGSALYESDHVASALDEIDRAARRERPFDVVHDHSGFTALAMSARAGTPVVHTLHGPFTEQTASFYSRHGHKAHLVAISRSQFELAPRGVRPVAVVPNPLVVEDWPLLREKQDYLLWMGRMDPVKGAHRAIDAARMCGQRLVLAGPVQPGQREYFASEVQPHIDGKQIVYVGEVGGRRREELFAGARAFLMPIRWPEPFGMVMVEALACGTPVIAFPEGAASEIVIDGENGFHVTDESEMAAAVRRLQQIDPVRCRESVAERYDVSVVAEGYEAVYDRAIREATQRTVRVDRHRRLTSPMWEDTTRVIPRRAERLAVLQAVDR